MSDVGGLIQWMSHRGRGRWESFKGVVADVFADDESPPQPVWLANTLSMMGVADFFVKGSNRWQVLAPTIAGTSEGEAVVIGGRTTALGDRLREATAQEGIDLFEEPLRWGLHRVRLYAPADKSLARLGQSAGVPFVPRAADSVVRQAPSIEERVAQGRPVQAPRNWKIESYDFTTFELVSGDAAGTAKVFTPSRGVARYMFERADGSLIEMERRNSIYAAAWTRSIPLLHYDPDHSTISTPASAPLPADLARAAALCTGGLPSTHDGRTVFERVRWSVASVLLALTGCSLPVIPVQSGRVGA